MQRTVKTRGKSRSKSREQSSASQGLSQGLSMCYTQSGSIRRSARNNHSVDNQGSKHDTLCSNSCTVHGNNKRSSLSIIGEQSMLKRATTTHIYRPRNVGAPYIKATRVRCTMENIVVPLIVISFAVVLLVSALVSFI